MENDFVTIARFQFVHDPGLEMLQIKLEDADIQSVVFNQNMGGLAPLHNWAAGGIQVRVPAEDEQAAALIWEELRKTLEYADFEDPELAKMRSEEEEGMQRNWRACLISLAVLALIFVFLLLATR